MARARFETELIERARSGDNAAVSTVMERLRPLLQAFFRYRIRDRFKEDDLVQNTLLRVLNGLPKLKKAESFKSYAMKAALSELRDKYRGRHSSKEMLPDPAKVPQLAAPGSGSAAVLSLDTERALASLKPRARRIIELKVLGYKYREIAKELNTTEAAIKMQVRRAFKAMRAALAEYTLLF